MKKLFVMMSALLAFGFASAQSEVIAKFNEGAKAVQAKNYASAITLFETVIDKGMDSEDNTVLNCVATAKKYLPVCYQGVGLSAASQKNYAKAIEYLTKAADTAELYGNTTAKTKANTILAKVYQVQGGTYFNAGDFAKAIEVFAKGYSADKKNTALAMMLAESYFKSNNYAEGVKVCAEVAALPSPKYDAAIAEAKAKMGQYTNNKIAELQKANDFDGIIAMSETIADKALAQKVLVQAYFLKKDYDKVIEIGEAAAALQTDDESKSAVYFNLGSAYNAKEMKDKAVAALSKVTAGPSVEAAKAAIAGLTAPAN